MSDSALRRQVAQLASELARTQAEVHTLRRGARRPQLGNSSIDSGSLDVVDSETGQVRLRLGYQPDGSVGVVPEGGDPHPAPATPVVEPIPSGLSVSWDGSLSGLDTLPADFDHVNVYVSIESGFTPSGVTFVGTITRSGGALPIAPLEVGTTYYVRLVPVGTGGVQGAPSPQASGVPAPVGGVPGPGSITETEIADDAISTPKLQAEAVTALKIAAQAIEAGHIQAAAITAAKLEADLVLGTRIIAGNPSGARVELDENGLRGYDADDALVFAIDDTGNAIFTGNITGSEISGSRILMGTPGGGTGTIEELSGAVRVLVTAAGGQRAQMSASADQTQLAVWAGAAASAPMGGLIAQPDVVALTLQSVGNDPTAPYSQHGVVSGEAIGLWRAGTESAVQLRATQVSASMMLTATDATTPGDEQGPGFLFANRSVADDIAAVSLQSPRWEGEGDPASLRRSVLFAEGANTGRPYTRMVHAARRVLVMGEATGGAYDTTSDGMLDLANTHSIRAPRHSTVVGQFNDAVPAGTTNGEFVDFTAAQWDRVTVKTGASGRVQVIVRAFGYSSQTTGSSLAIGWRTSNGDIEAHLDRAYYFVCGSTSYSQMLPCVEHTFYATLTPDTTYTFIPCWRKSSGAWGSAVHMSNRLHGTALLVTPLM